MILILLSTGCTDPGTSVSPTGPTVVPTTPDSTPGTVIGADLVPRLAGLWTGPGRQTPLGTFPIVTVDIRAADPHTLWGRVDFDPENALRFAWAVEDRHPDTLVYRNGGFFLGLLRDDRTVLTDAGPDHYRFCHATAGCERIDALYRFDDPDTLTLDVLVRGEPHLLWEAVRVEARTLPEGFPAPGAIPADGPLPILPELRLEVTWSTPLEATADVWVILSTQPCFDLSLCVPSRTSRAVAAVGETASALMFPEIHSGEYLATAVLDRDRNLIGTLLPSLADGLSLPDRPITVLPTGTTEDRISVLIQP